MNIEQIDKTGTLENGELFEWHIPGWILKNPHSQNRSDFFTLKPDKKYRFCLVINSHFDWSSNCTTANVQLHRLSVPEAGAPKLSAWGSSFYINVRFTLFKNDSLYKGQCDMWDHEDVIQLDFPEILTFDSLTIHCVMKAFRSPHCSSSRYSDGETQCLTLTKVSNSTSQAEHSLQQDMATLLKESKFSDVTVCVDGNKFNVHRCILASRSDVFAAMLDHDTLEQQDNRIVIVDFSSDVMGQLLRYIYTDQTDELTFHQWFALLSAADKYAISGLKKKCSDHLRTNMSTDIVFHALIVADLHHEEDLKEAAVLYFLDNTTKVMSSDEWMPFLKNHTELANSILLRLAKKSCK